MNFKIVTNTKFSVGIDFHKRIYSVQEKKDGTIKITSSLDGSVLFDKLNASEIVIDNFPMQNISDLQNIVFNRSCICDPDKEDEDYKIFDDSFDKKFE